MVKDERLEDLCGVYKELNIEEKKKMERIAVRLFNTQISNDDKSSSIENKENTKFENE